jgi:hypothetical protein
MPTLYLKMWDNDIRPFIMPLPYNITGKKYIYGPDANGKRRKPVPLKPTPWQRVRDGYIDLFNILRGK